MILLRELADVLVDTVLYGEAGIRCVPAVDVADGPMGTKRVTLSVTFAADNELTVLNLLHELQYLQDLASLRALAERFEIPTEKLEALLPPKE